MDDYISRESAVKVLTSIGTQVSDSRRRAVATCINEIELLPAADVEPVRRWIPVSERLPELIPCSAGTAYSEAVNVWTTGRKVMVGVWDGIDWIAPFDCWEAWGEEVTHWMPLPEPPEMGGGAEDG